jgi:hypothetical protein
MASVLNKASNAFGSAAEFATVLGTTAENCANHPLRKKSE